MSDSASTNKPTTFEFAGWGATSRIENLNVSPQEIQHLDQEKRHFLGKWKATAICGNDITSSCLYVSALAISVAGIMAPVALLLVSFTLFLFKKIYAEVGSALPLNGGTYTLLLNTTTKKKAAMAATLTILSYIATAVISANEAIHYLHTVFSIIPIVEGTLLLLAVFAGLSILGVSESATVALGIFIINIVTLSSLIIGCTYLVLNNQSVLIENFTINFENADLGTQLFRGFVVALLGISGFESSANYIEEQQKGVFPKTLHNMWVAITVLNPTLCFLALGVFSLGYISEHQNGLLALMAQESAGKWFSIWMAVNAFLVLSGAVLTSFVGIIGLMRRMALDRCLPSFLLHENKWRKTNHWIILLFLAICISVYYITEGKIESLAGVYTISFLSVMILFAIGNALLKVHRAKLPRSVSASWSSVICACILVATGLTGNFLLNPEGAKIFSAYYVLTVGVILTILMRAQILRFLLLAIRKPMDVISPEPGPVSSFVERMIHSITSVPVAYFTKGDSIATLNRAALYVLRNEQTHNLQIIHFYEDYDTIPTSLGPDVITIDKIYPELKIDLLLVKGQLTPLTIQSLSKRLQIEKNRMFIGTPGSSFPHRVEALGGVRVII